ncbi:MAG: right-handed parallel beta-helix repeat-containing protein [Planctomycetota bacterium]
MKRGGFKRMMSAGREGARVLVLALGLTTSSVFGGPVIYVNQAATGVGDGSSWTDAYTDLQPAIDAAGASGGAIREIWVAKGTYKPSKRTDPNDPRSATFQLLDGIALYGGFAGTEASVDERVIDANPTVLSGDLNGDDGPDFVNYDENAYHVVTAIDVGNATLFDGLTVTAGHPASNRTLSSYGGGMYIRNAYPQIRNATFTRNLSERPLTNVAWSGGGGAALFVRQDQEYPGLPTLNVSGSRFTDNKSIGDGGAVLIWGTYFMGDVVFSECSFERNVGTAAFSAYGGSACTLRSCVFSDNSTDGPGGAVYISSDQALIEGCRFEGNSAGWGGALSLGQATAVTIRESLFVDNSAGSGYGGALRIYRVAMVELIDSEFRGNSAEYAGGAYLYTYEPATVRRCQFVNNLASGSDGGGLYVRGSVRLTECDFAGNHARASGGGLFVQGFLDATACTFTDNSAWGQGGAAFAYSYEAVRFEDGEFERNWALFGGAVCCVAPHAIFDRCRVEHNGALVGGGVAALESGTNIQLVNSLLAGNQAESYGGGIATGDVTLTVQNCTIANNTADALGAGIIAGHDTSITNSIVWGNVLDPDGGAWTDEVAQIEGIEFATIEYSDVQGWSGAYGGDGNIGLDPLFVAPTDPDGQFGPIEPDFHLLPDSPCINAGLTWTPDPGPWGPPPPNLDLDGKPRVLCKFVDMGAYEFGLMGDVDCNQRVDLDDFSLWSQCAFGPGAPGLCSPFDADGDGDVDLRDLAEFLRVFSSGSP